MSCNKIKKRLIFYLEGELSKADYDFFKNHINTCHSCKLLEEKLKTTLQAIEKEKTIALNPFFATRIMESINRIKQQKAELYVNPWLRWVLQPALIMIIAMAGIYAGIELGNFYKKNINMRDSYTSVYWDDLSQEPMEDLLLSE